MIKSSVVCDADVWIKYCRVNYSHLIFKTFMQINMVGVVVREIKYFKKCIKPKQELHERLKNNEIIIRRQKDFSDERRKHFKYILAVYRSKHNLTERKSTGEIVSAFIAQELKIPIILSDDHFTKTLAKEFELQLYTHYDVLDHCQTINELKKAEADKIYDEIEKLGVPKSQKRDLLNKLKRNIRYSE